MRKPPVQLAPPHDPPVMWRDASFWPRPGKAARYHLPSARKGPFGHPTARCNHRIQLDETHTSTMSQAGDLVCRRCLKSQTRPE